MPSRHQVGAADQKGDDWLRPWKGPAEALWQGVLASDRIESKVRPPLFGGSNFPDFVPSFAPC